MLEDRLVDAVQSAPDVAELATPEDTRGLARRWGMTRRERQAEAFDAAADQIEAGLVKIKGADPAVVLERVRTRADKIRAGTDRPKPKSTRIRAKD